MAAENKAGLTRKFSEDSAWLLNRDAIADRYGISPVEIEGWPSYEREVAIKLLQIRSRADILRPKRRTS